jgi:hypothetical protein
MLVCIRYIDVLVGVIVLTSGFRTSRLLTSPVKELLLMLRHVKREDDFDLPVAKGQCDLIVSVNPFQTNIYSTCFGHSNKFTAYLSYELTNKWS